MNAQILIVDDEPSIRDSLHAVLSAEGYGVDLAGDLPEAIGFLAERTYDVVVSDVKLPGGGGIELLDSIRAACPNAPVIFITGDPTVETAAEALRGHAFDYLAKPVGKNAMLRSVGNAVRLKQVEDERRRLQAANEGYQHDLEELVVRRTEELRTTNRRLEEALAQLRESQQQVVQSERLGALGQMASGIAHDFNNVLTPIIGITDFVLSNEEVLDDRAELLELLKSIHSAGQDGKEIVRRLREFYRPSEQLETAPVDIRGMCERVITLTEPKWRKQARAENRQINIDIQFDDLPPVLGNESQLREVCTNLFLNACDAMPDGGTIKISGGVSDDCVHIRLTDTGTGMDAETLKRCREPFFTTKKDHGTGLGLSMCHGIIERHGGALYIDSDEGAGTQVIIQLPVAEEQCLAETSATYTDHEKQDTDGALHILVIDSDRATVFILDRYLKALGHTTRTVFSSEAALEACREEDFDVAITNRALPKMNGDQLAAKIKQVQPGIRIMMLTGFADEMKLRGETPSNVDLLESKPLTQNRLSEALSTLTEKVA